MQKPTLKNVKIRSTRDALLVFYGVARNVLPLITRRLDAEERRAIVPGNVYVWEERGANTESTGIGMERWTDGMGWGPSRVRDEFLFYHQKEFELGEDANSASTPWAQMISVYPASHSRLASDAERLIKQTYSVHVSLPADRPRGITRKWHLTAYFSQQRLDGLATLDTIPGVGDLDVPDGWFKSARAGKSRRDHRDSSSASGAVVHSNSNSSSNNSFPKPALPSDAPPPPMHQLHDMPTDTPRQDPAWLRSAPPNMPYSSDVNTAEYRHSHHPCSSPSSSSEQSTSPKQSPLNMPLAVAGQLVPLQYLQTISYPRRDPTDEQLLRRFSTHSLSPSSRVPQSSRLCGR